MLPLYVYQKLLWEYAQKFSRALNRETILEPHHLSVWNFANLSSELPLCDVIISNHCLCEMSEEALICYAKRILAMWRKNNIRGGRWIAQSLGASNITPLRACQIMDSVGFSLIEHTPPNDSKFNEIYFGVGP